LKPRVRLYPRYLGLEEGRKCSIQIKIRVFMSEWGMGTRQVKTTALSQLFVSLRPEDQEFDTSLENIVSSRPVWPI
jgi:hypothetical protein